MFYGPATQNLANLNDNNMFASKSYGEKVYKVLLRVEQKFLRREIKSSQGLEVAQCYFPEEANHLQLSNIYTQNNCFLRCKLDMVLKKCDCLPWFVEYEGKEFNVCGLFGNKCYEQMMLRVNKFVEVRDPKDPPCGCFPICQDTRYQLHWKQGQDNNGEDEYNLIDFSKRLSFS